MSAESSPEDERLRNLWSFGVLDTPPEPAFDRLTRLAGRLFRAPIALVSLVDRDRQWFKSCLGLDARQTPREQAFCSHALGSPRTVLEVTNALEDPRFADNALVTGAPRIRYYAGAPLVSEEGQVLGTLCVIDRVPRSPMSGEDRALLRDMAECVVSELHQHRRRIEQSATLSAARNLAELTRRRLDRLAHETKSPLSSILGYSALLQRDDLPLSAREFVERIEFAGRHILALVKSSLEASELSEEEAEPASFTARSVIDEVLLLAQPMAKSLGVTAELEGDDQQQLLGPPPLRVRQILLNLVSNALKHGADGGFMAIRGWVEDDQLLIEVEDEGKGVPEDVQPTLFLGIHSAGKGSHGCGLMVASQLARTHGGRLSYRPARERGAIFRLELPVRVTPATPDDGDTRTDSGPL